MIGPSEKEHTQKIFVKVVWSKKLPIHITVCSDFLALKNSTLVAQSWGWTLKWIITVPNYVLKKEQVILNATLWVDCITHIYKLFWCVKLIRTHPHLVAVVRDNASLFFPAPAVSLKASLIIAPQCAPVLSSPVSPPPDVGQYYDATPFCCFMMICEQLKGWEALRCAPVRLVVSFSRLICL